MYLQVEHASRKFVISGLQKGGRLITETAERITQLRSHDLFTNAGCATQEVRHWKSPSLLVKLDLARKLCRSSLYSLLMAKS